MFFAFCPPTLGCSSCLASPWSPWPSAKGLVFLIHVLVAMVRLYGATILVRGVPKWVRRCHAGAATGAFNGIPYGATILVMDVPKWVRRCHAGAATGAFGGAPDGATTVVMGVPRYYVALWGERPAPTTLEHSRNLEYFHGGFTLCFGRAGGLFPSCRARVGCVRS